MSPKLSILMSALVCRRDYRNRVEPAILSQISALPDPSSVELLIEEDAGKLTSGAKRNILTARARGDYVAFVDDDDEVSPNYVARMLDGVATGADVVTFQLEFHKSTGGPPVLWEFHLRSQDHRLLPSGAKSMTANHLCAWKRDIAASVPWLPIGFMDDCFWYRGLIATGRPTSEHHIPAVLYHYMFRWPVTQNQTSVARSKTRKFAATGIDYYWWNRPGGDRCVAIAAHDRAKNRGKKLIDVYTPGGVLERASTDDMTRFYEITLR